MIFARKLHVLKGEVVFAGGDLQVHLYLATIRAIWALVMPRPSGIKLRMGVRVQAK